MKPLTPLPARLTALGCAALLAACAAGPPTPPAPDVATDRGEQPVAPLPIRTGESPLAGLFAPAMAALDAGDWMRASLALPTAPSGETPSAEYLAYRALAEARAADLRGDATAVRSALASAPRQGISGELALRLLDFERRQARRRGDYLASARLGIRALALLPVEDPVTAALGEACWLDLQHLDEADLLAARRGAAIDLRGWLDRVRVARGDLTAEQWRARYPAHRAERIPVPPAAAPPPRIALLLPLSGRLAAAAAAVRDGFLAAWYAAAERPGLLVIDTERYGGTVEAYRAAADQGAGLVIGPLTKEAVAEVAAQPSLPVPVLALNRAETPDASSVLQFALAPEDEAREIARHALAAGHRRALLLRPAGAWGDKVASALVERWADGGGVVAARGTFTSREDHSETIERALQLDQSAARGQALRRLLDRDMVLAGRRREDIDAIFLLAPSTEDAKSLKPLLAYHYAGALPAYATSAANSAGTTAADRDLTGLRLVELPWFLGKDVRLRSAVTDAGLSGEDLDRLQALGTDAWALARRHRALDPGGTLLVDGATGFLTVNDSGEITRELPLAVFARGGLERQ